MNKWMGSVMAVITVISFGTVLWSAQSHPKYGVIDTNYIVLEQAKILAKKYPNAPVSPQRLRQITDHLKETVGQWCADHKVLLFSKGALWGGELPDYTQEILTVLELPRSDA